MEYEARNANFFLLFKIFSVGKKELEAQAKGEKITKKRNQKLAAQRKINVKGNKREKMRRGIFKSNVVCEEKRNEREIHKKKKISWASVERRRKGCETKYATNPEQRNTKKLTY